MTSTEQTTLLLSFTTFLWINEDFLWKCESLVLNCKQDFGYILLNLNYSLEVIPRFHFKDAFNSDLTGKRKRQEYTLCVCVFVLLEICHFIIDTIQNQLVWTLQWFDGLSLNLVSQNQNEKITNSGFVNNTSCVFRNMKWTISTMLGLSTRAAVKFVKMRKVKTMEENGRKATWPSR